MSFKDIKGQDSAVSFLKKAVENGRVAHAYIFAGPEGVGRRKTALNFAKALNCLAADPDSRPCDRCASCGKIDSSNHPDIFTLEPEGKGEVIKIERVRELINNIGLKPYEGKKKVYIIDGADSMRPDAANALLKTLEEPPPESVLILITKNQAFLFPTIVSRSQVVRFFPLEVDDVKGILMEGHGADGAEAGVLSRLASGRIGLALRYKDSGIFDKRGAIIDSLSNNTFFDIDFDDIEKDDLKVYLDIMLTWYRDILAAKAGLTETCGFYNADRYDAIMDAAKAARADDIENIIKEILMTNSFLDRNVNAKLAMSVLGLKLINSNP